jgi:Sulfotransferase family
MTQVLIPPIILIGNYRSGTSVTQKLIGLHPGIVTWYEPRSVWLYSDPGRRHDEFDEADATATVNAYIRKRFLNHQIYHGNRRVMEKTPGNVLRVPYVRTIFPEATYLHITRNPFSYISSMEFKWQRTKTLQGIRRSLGDVPIMQLPYYARHLAVDMVRKKVLRQRYVSIYGPRYRGIDDDLKSMSRLKVIARQWAIGNRMARENLARMGRGRVFSFRYEDLMKAPRDYFSMIYDHCGLKYDESMLAAAEKVVDPNRQSKWLRLGKQQIKSVMPELEAEMNQYGYQVPPELE